MKIELTKETKVDMDEPTGTKTWYWVVINDSRVSPSSVFHEQEKAKKYFTAIKEHYSKHNTFKAAIEVLLSETI